MRELARVSHPRLIRPSYVESMSADPAWRFAAAVLLTGAFALLGVTIRHRSSADPPPRTETARAVPVVAAPARARAVGVYLTGLGTVTPLNTVTVKTQVSGKLMAVMFHEGQLVNEGDVSAQIDPRPFEAQLTQFKGQLARDQALLENAKVDLQRYQVLYKQDSVPQQQLATQDSLVHQLEGTVQNDQGQIDAVTVQLDYCRITSPTRALGRLDERRPIGRGRVDDGRCFVCGPGEPGAFPARHRHVVGAGRLGAGRTPANAQIGVAVAAFFPSLTPSASTGFESSSLSPWLTAASHFWSVGPGISQTVVDGGLRRAQTDAARAAYDASVAAYRQTVLGAFQGVEDNLAALRVLQDEARVQDEAVTAAQESVRLTTNQYLAGIVSYLNVITTQTTALTNEVTAVQILGCQMTAAVLLVQALGGGWSAADLPSAGEVTRREAPGPSR